MERPENFHEFPPQNQTNKVLPIGEEANQQQLYGRPLNLFAGNTDLIEFSYKISQFVTNLFFPFVRNPQEIPQLQFRSKWVLALFEHAFDS